MFLSWFLYVVLVLVFCMCMLMVDYLVYEISIERLINTRVCRLRCKYAQKTLRLQNLKDRKNCLSDCLTGLYHKRHNNQNAIDKCSLRLKKVSKEIDKVNLELEMIDLKLKELNKY